VFTEEDQPPEVIIYYQSGAERRQTKEHPYAGGDPQDARVLQQAENETWHSRQVFPFSWIELTTRPSEQIEKAQVRAVRCSP
jgi:hypothetical protein